MKNIIEAAWKLMFVIGALVIGVGGMAVVLRGQYLSEYDELLSSGSQIHTVITKKGISRSGGGSRSSTTTHYFQVEYLGRQGEKKFTIIYPTAEEFEAYGEGSRIAVLYDPGDPGEAVIVKSAAQREALKRQPYVIMLAGAGMIIAANILRMVHKKQIRHASGTIAPGDR